METSYTMHLIAFMFCYLLKKKENSRINGHKGLFYIHLPTNDLGNKEKRIKLLIRIELVFKKVLNNKE